MEILFASSGDGNKVGPAIIKVIIKIVYKQMRYFKFSIPVNSRIVELVLFVDMYKLVCTRGLVKSQVIK